MTFDKARLRAQLRSLQRQTRHHGHPLPDPAELSRLVHSIDVSIRRAEARSERLPRVCFPEDLPVSKRKDEIAAAIREHQVVVLCGATGSGKTTQLPKICLELGRGVRGMIGHTQPRRIAARSVAQRIASELGSPLGSDVGFKVRFTDQVNDRTYVKLMTDGILLAESQGDRELGAYDTIIIDEAHERSLNIDFLLGYLRQLLPHRPDLKLIITSATIDPQRFADHFALPGRPKPPVIEVSGRMYPVEVRYRPLRGTGDGEEDRELEDAIVDATEELGRESPGDVLVFLPGEREIRETAEALKKRYPHAGGRTDTRGKLQVEVIPLYARLSTEEQQRVFEPHDTRRIVLATNVAETSLTVPGIRYVIDSGLARIGRYSPRVKVQRLPIEPISRASANQRAGRCGRTSSGICIRLYEQAHHDNRPEFTDPEIIRTNLASVILQMKALALGEIDDFPFVLSPDPRNVRDGFETLLELGAIEGGGLRHDLTAIGSKLARLPVDPRIGRMILAAERERCIRDVIIIASALSVPDPRERPMDKAEAADSAHGPFRHERSDFLTLWNIWREYHKQERGLSGGGLRRWCREKFLSHIRFREWQDIHRQLVSLVEDMGLRMDDRPAGSGQTAGENDRRYEQIHRSLLAGLLSSIGTKNANNPREYDGARGSKYAIFPGSGLFKASPKWIMAAEVVKTTKTYARTVAAISPAWIESLASHLVKRTYAEPHWDAETAQSMAYETVSLYGLELVKRRRVAFGEIDPKQARTLFIHHALVNGEYMTSGKFFEHNHTLTKSVESLQQRARTRDLLADQSSRFGFYDKRLPEEVVSGPAFEHWRRKAEAREPRLLEMATSDVVAPGAALPTIEQFPDHVIMQTSRGSPDLKLSLTYKHDPAAIDDGVTITIPERVLTLVNPDRLEWLVPGMIQDRLVAMIKGLPKGLRTTLVPAPTVAERALSRMKFGEGKLSEAFTDAIRAGAVGDGAGGGTYVPIDQWALSDLPNHARMFVRVLDERGKVVVEGRDLSAIRGHVDKRARDVLSNLPDGPLNRAGVTVWGGWVGEASPGEHDPTSASLPASVQVPWLGMTRTLYPALTLEPDGRTVSVRQYDEPVKAATAAKAGLRQLLALQLAKEARSLIETTPGIERVGVLYAAMGKPRELYSDLAETAALLAFDDGFVPTGAHARSRSLSKRGAAPAYVILPAEDVRSWPAFEERLNWGWDRLGGSGSFVIEIAQQTLEAYQRVALMLVDPATTPARQAACFDIRSQLVFLLPPRFLKTTPTDQLRNLPRYVRAIERRLDKLGLDGGERDTRNLHELTPYWRAMATRAEQSQGRRDLLEEPSFLAFRWLLEEYRVSLFAQELGVSTAVSAKRLDQAWVKVLEADQRREAAGVGGGRK